METFGERLAWAMAGGDGRPKTTQTQLAKACGCAQSVVSDWTRGDSQTMKAIYLFPAAKRLQVDPEWLITGKGDWRPTSHVSQSMGPSHATLAESLKWLDYLEAKDGKLGYIERGIRLAELYAKAEEGGGSMLPAVAEQLLGIARDRPPQEGGKNEGRRTARRRQ